MSVRKPASYVKSGRKTGSRNGEDRHDSWRNTAKARRPGILVEERRQSRMEQSVGLWIVQTFGCFGQAAGLRRLSAALVSGATCWMRSFPSTCKLRPMMPKPR